MSYIKLVCLILTVNSAFCSAADRTRTDSGNPLFEGWYADPEGIIFDDEYWIFPTLSGTYGQADKASRLSPQQ